MLNTKEETYEPLITYFNQIGNNFSNKITILVIK